MDIPGAPVLDKHKHYTQRHTHTYTPPAIPFISLPHPAWNGLSSLSYSLTCHLKWTYLLPEDFTHWFYSKKETSFYLWFLHMDVWCRYTLFVMLFFPNVFVCLWVRLSQVMAHSNLCVFEWLCKWLGSVCVLLTIWNEALHLAWLPAQFTVFGGGRGL